MCPMHILIKKLLVNEISQWYDAECNQGHIGFQTNSMRKPAMKVSHSPKDH